ncbi:MAG: alpha/beta hydrolase, partial [Halanaerobiales bacterium]
FTPGTMSHPLFYDEFLTLLARNKFNVIGVHLISHGKSPREKSLFTFQDMVENIKDTISYCIDKYNENIVLMGSSQGGILSAAVAGYDNRIKAVFSHNIILPSLKDTIKITRIPCFLKTFWSLVPEFIKVCAKIFPGVQIPVSTYLDLEKITSNKKLIERFFYDPIGLRTYPLYFLASLFSADLKGLTNGNINCPLVLITSKSDKLFSFEYCNQVFRMIKAPDKEMIVFRDLPHLIFNENFEEVINPIVKKLNYYIK